MRSLNVFIIIIIIIIVIIITITVPRTVKFCQFKGSLLCSCLGWSHASSLPPKWCAQMDLGPIQCPQTGSQPCTWELPPCPDAGMGT